MCESHTIYRLGINVNIRNAEFSDIPSILEHCKYVHRMVCFDEIWSWMQSDPGAIFVAEYTGEDLINRVVGVCCGMSLGSELGFMGLYMVQEGFRGHGIGSRLWKSARQHLGNRNVGVRGDEKNFLRYKELHGFVHVPEYKIAYYECFENSQIKRKVPLSGFTVATFLEGQLIKIRSESDHPDLEYVDPKSYSSKNVSESSVNVKVGSLTEYSSVSPKLTSDSSDSEICMDKNLNAEEILIGVVNYDRSLHNRDRSYIVRQTLSWDSCKSKVALISNKVVGYGCLRKVVTGHWIISPFYSDSQDIAELLLFELLQDFDFSDASKGIQIRFPDKNNLCHELLFRFGFKDILLRIFTGFSKCCPNLDISKVYSFHSTVFCSE